MNRFRAGIVAALGLALAGCAAPGPEIAATQAPANLPIEVKKPDGAGPFPAVVMLHDCSGLGPRSSGAPARWAKVLVDQGYVVVIPDSFSKRGHAQGVCTDPDPASRNEVNAYRRAQDAFAALAYARSLPYVDGKRVGVMGGSHGGSTTLAAMVAPPGPFGVERTTGFAAAVALYPGCRARFGDWNPDAFGIASVYRTRAPLLILVGEKDDWTPAEPCRRLAETSSAAGYPVTVKIYPGAHHSFDNTAPVRYVEARVNGNAPGGRGATTGGNAEAWADSIRQVSEFFGRFLK